jgi:hypothetical protein
VLNVAKHPFLNVAIREQELRPLVQKAKEEAEKVELEEFVPNSWMF